MISFFITLKRVVSSILQTLKDEEGRSILIFVTSLLLSGTIFYSTIESMKPLDALYYYFMTLTTIGYGDFVPMTAIGKIFTMLYSIIGLGSMALLITHIATGYTKSKAISQERRAKAKDRIKEKAKNN